MIDKRFEIDRDSAERLHAVLCDETQLSPEAFKLAFTNVLTRKMELENAAAACDPKDTDNFAKLERLFDMMFVVEPEGLTDKQVAEQAAKASVHLLNEATKAELEGEADMAEMYGSDLKDYMLIRAYFEEGKLVKAYEMWNSLDTASRDNLYIGLDETGEEKLNKALARYEELRRKERTAA